MMSKDIFEQNLKAMDKWYPSFSEAIRTGRYVEDDLKIDMEYSSDGEKIYRVNKDGRSLYLNGKRNAGEPVQTWRERMGEIHKYAPVFLLGLGTGSYLKALAADVDQTVNVIVYEPSVKIFLKTLEEVNLSEMIEERLIAFVVEGLNGNEFEPVARSLVSVETVQFLHEEIHPNYQELFTEEIMQVLRALEKVTNDLIVNSQTGALFSAQLAKNQMQNMQFLCDGYNTKGLAQAIPHEGAAILVAAGPSLNKNIQELKKAKNRAFLLAVDTAVKPLLRAGIVPDAFITIDPNKPLKLVDTDEIRDIPLVTPITANHEIVEQQRGKKIFFYDGYRLGMNAYLSVGKLLPSVSCGGSVACSGFSLLFKMGFQTIILVGQDLAYTDNRSHADGTFQDIMPERDTANMIRVKGNYEKDVPTLENLKIYLDWFNMYIKGAKEHEPALRVINATEGGAYIEGTELLSLADAIENNCTSEIHFDSYIEGMESAFSREDRFAVVEYIHSIPQEFDIIKRESKNLYRAYHKILNISKSRKMDKQAYLKQLKKAKKSQKKVEEQLAYQLISDSMPTAEYIVRSESLCENDTLEEEGIAIATQGMRFAKMIEECATILKEYADEVLLAIS